ncbi:MAG: 50S ribosomal protein L9 [Christensenellaceae bacterium]|jgi:large subunit ribosomal protein L9|nr:50S ribosomal protein L9 [Christensenellaceae bacterium]
MKVILLKDIKGTGKKDQIIEASDGFARNYLLPRKLAVEASAANLNAIAGAKAAADHRREAERLAALEQAKKLEEFTVTVSVRAGEKGRLFGKVTNQEIADALKAQFGLEIDRRKISVGTIKELGENEAELKLFAEISAKLKLRIVAQE